MKTFHREFIMERFEGLDEFYQWSKNIQNEVSSDRYWACYSRK